MGDVYKGMPECPACGTDTSAEMAAELRAERDQLRQQVEGLLSAVEEHRANREQFPKGPSKRNQALWAAADQVRKELGE